MIFFVPHEKRFNAPMYDAGVAETQLRPYWTEKLAGTLAQCLNDPTLAERITFTYETANGNEGEAKIGIEIRGITGDTHLGLQTMQVLDLLTHSYRPRTIDEIQKYLAGSVNERIYGVRRERIEAKYIPEIISRINNFSPFSIDRYYAAEKEGDMHRLTLPLHWTKELINVLLQESHGTILQRVGGQHLGADNESSLTLEFTICGSRAAKITDDTVRAFQLLNVARGSAAGSADEVREFLLSNDFNVHCASIVRAVPEQLPAMIDRIQTYAAAHPAEA